MAGVHEGTRKSLGNRLRRRRSRLIWKGERSKSKLILGVFGAALVAGAAGALAESTQARRHPHLHDPGRCRPEP